MCQDGEPLRAAHLGQKQADLERTALAGPEEKDARRLRSRKRPPPFSSRPVGRGRLSCFRLLLFVLRAAFDLGKEGDTPHGMKYPLTGKSRASGRSSTAMKARRAECPAARAAALGSLGVLAKPFRCGRSEPSALREDRQRRPGLRAPQAQAPRPERERFSCAACGQARAAQEGCLPAGRCPGRPLCGGPCFAGGISVSSSPGPRWLRLPFLAGDSASAARLGSRGRAASGGSGFSGGGNRCATGAWAPE